MGEKRPETPKNAKKSARCFYQSHRADLVRVTGLDSRRELRALVVRGSDSRLGCHSLPLLLQAPSRYDAKTPPTFVGGVFTWCTREENVRTFLVLREAHNN